MDVHTIAGELLALIRPEQPFIENFDPWNWRFTDEFAHNETLCVERMEESRLCDLVGLLPIFTEETERLNAAYAEEQVSDEARKRQEDYQTKLAALRSAEPLYRHFHTLRFFGNSSNS